MGPPLRSQVNGSPSQPFAHTHHGALHIVFNVKLGAALGA